MDSEIKKNNPGEPFSDETKYKTKRPQDRTCRPPVKFAYIRNSRRITNGITKISTLEIIMRTSDKFTLIVFQKINR